ncbi:calcium channel subunit Cch1 [Blastomyces gilchristii SLH14081]|uniref:Calcium-channel protein CCH1 n=1 Tax=Blastomyces gilchristii (strain SLH14081) TaxID=559298 RepID=A0A179U9D1_BLAGS|nr:calcium channel subunit Cch1 [Blastomyces gilchristii SLH14081]OAT03551.1 calcium channel subunit Cch1 [Blastomyces gilchristii SLH14081]
MASPNNNNNKDNNNNDNGYDPRNYGPGPSPVDQSIPLQDLSRPPDIATAGVPDRRRRRTSSSSSTAGREGFPVRRTSIIGRRGIGRRYERIAEDSPSPRERSGMDTFHTVNLSSDHLHHNSPISLADGGQEFSAGAHHSFQEAIGSVGLSFDGPATIHFSGRDSGPQRSYQAHVRHSDDSTPFPYMGSQTPIDEENYMSPIDTNENDTTPLTDRRYQQPIDGASISHGQRHDRPSVHFASERTAVGPHLVDDLPHSEEGNSRMRSGSGGRNRPGRRSRQLAPAPNSALSRAGSMMRMMSQRVVNISNEPEIVDQTLRHKSSLKQARLEAPPSLPAMTEYAHDISTPGLDDGYPPEKRPSLFSKLRDPDAYQTEENPLKGNSLGIFSPNSKLRRGLLEILIHPAVEPIILILIIIQTILLAIESSVYKGERGSRWGTPAFDYAFLVLFLIYTLEISARIIVSGLMFNADEYSTLDRSLGLRKALVAKGKDLLMPQRGLSTRKSGNPTEPQISVLRSFTGAQNTADRSGHSSSLQRYRLARRAFFRHSFTRIDFLAVVSYWISFVLSNLSLESQHHLYVFRMLSCLRILRLLGLTSGTSVIFRSLKKAAPLLVHVAFLISFFWLLFAIVGVQSFKSSMRRTCVWVDPENQSNFTLNAAPDNVQFCGGYRELGTGASKPWVLPDGTAGAAAPKGYLCPEGSLCVQGSNPYGGTISFDDVAHSLQLVFVVMSSNTFTDILYYMTDTDYLAAALFFVFGFIVLSLWLVNLLVAVITSSFQVIREESKRSAFTSEHIDEREFEDDTPRKLRGLKLLYDRTYWLWIAVITFGLVVQGLRSSSMGPHRRKLIDRTEILVTIILAAEIFLRFASDWRNFFKGARNWVDLALAIITCIIIIPPIRYSGRTYAALSIFQVLRIYRIVLAFSVMSDLIKTVFKNVVGLLNLIIFVFLITFLASIFAVQLFRGQIPSEDIGGNEIQITFFDIYNSFLGMYQILSSENWTAILYSAVESTYPWNTAWISAIFVIMWFILANFVVLNMFIAVIQESFDVSEDEKRIQQVKAFLQQKQLSGSSQGNLSLSTIFRLGRNSRFRDPLDHGPAALEMLLKDAVVNEFLDEQPRSPPADIQPTEIQPGHPEHKNGVTNFFSSFKNRIMNREPNPFYSKLKFSKVYDDSDPTAMAKEVLSASEQRKRAQRQYLQKYPNYNVSLYIFKPTNPLRRFCQRIVGPGRGSSRIEGIDPYKPVWYTFSAFIYAAIVAMVLLACIATPLYQRNYLQTHKPGLSNWFVWTDLAFAIIFTIEAVIKVIADGFFWTPNAYFRGSWGFIDGIVLITLWINVVSAIFNATATSRVVGAFKALRALRLLNVSDSARETFHAVIILGGWKVISAAFVSMSFLVPFAIYGLNLFNGQFKSCNDDDFGYSSLDHCVGEYMSSPYAWDVLAPRVVSNPYFSFDNFGESLFILFQIVSQEGWTGVLWEAMAITGVNQQPVPLASQENGLFFVVFNLLGAVFVLTLFVSVFMRNYTEQTGVAFLTAEQRSWLELRKHLRQISPSKRSIDKDSSKIKSWCYKIAVKKHGRWSRFITGLLLCHLLLLVLEFYPESVWWDRTRDILFLIFTMFYIANIFIRVVGLTWQRFSRSSWDLYSIISVSGTFVTTMLSVVRYENIVFTRLHKLFLVSIALLMIPRNNQLDQLFKTAAASLTAIGNLLATWFVLFLVYAIALTQIFGLTKFGEGETGSINFRDVPRALILLFRTSVGEGWNEVMEDFATMVPPYCTADGQFFESDCGSAGWARTLFISWNIVSMYIFVSLFVSLIFESFSYVYQRSSGLYAISREEIRRFKQAWATYDPDGTGYISKEAFPRLLGELSGIFEMRIYDGDFTVGRIVEDCKVHRRESNQAPYVRAVDGIDLDKLRRRIDRIPVQQIRRKRARMNAFYEEVLVSADPEKGISFTSCLMILAHYNVITDSKSLRLEEFLRRRARLQRVEEAVRRSVVIGFFDTLYWSRKFRRRFEPHHDSRLVSVPQFAVPEIFVEDGEHEEQLQQQQQEQQQEQQQQRQRSHSQLSDPTFPSPMLSPDARSRSSGGSDGRGHMRSPPSIDTNVSPMLRGTGSPTRGNEWVSRSPSLSPRQSRALYGSTPPSPDDITNHRPDDSSVSVQGVMESLDNSAWGESIRRSFTMRRPQGRE